MADRRAGRRRRRWPARSGSGRGRSGSSTASATPSTAPGRCPSPRWPARRPCGARCRNPPPSGEVVLYLSAGDAGDGREGDVVVWRRPRLEMPGRPPLLLRDVRGLGRYLARPPPRDPRRDAASTWPPRPRRRRAATGRRSRRWPDRTTSRPTPWPPGSTTSGWPARRRSKIDGYFTKKDRAGRGLRLRQGLGLGRDARPGRQLVRPGGACPGPAEAARRRRASLADPVGRDRLAQPGRRPGAGRRDGGRRARRLRQRRHLVARAAPRRPPPAARRPAHSATARRRRSRRSTTSPCRPATWSRSSIGPRDGNHGCDLTEVDLTSPSPATRPDAGTSPPDVSGDILAGNPHADRLGNPDVWHFYTEPVGDRSCQPVVPARLAARPMARDEPARREGPARRGGRDAVDLRRARPPARRAPTPSSTARPARWTARCSARWPRRAELGSAPRCRAGAIPAGSGASIRRSSASPSAASRSTPRAWASRRPRCWRSACRPTWSPGASSSSPASSSPRRRRGERAAAADRRGRRASRSIACGPACRSWSATASRARRGSTASLDEFRRVFPAGALLPPDRAGGRGRHADPVLPRGRALRPADARRRRQGAGSTGSGTSCTSSARTASDVYQTFDQMLGVRLAGGRPPRFEPLRKPITAAVRGRREGAGRRRAEAARRPARLRRAGLSPAAVRAARSTSCARSTSSSAARSSGHDEAFRLVLARVLVSPAFLYRVERPGPGNEARPVSDWELASRLSYFLWSSMPDDELRRLAAAGRLHDPEVLAAQARRMLRDEKARGLATEFACQWLHIHDFDTLDEKSERHFPTFARLRGAMYEEAIRFFTDLFQNDGSVLELLDARSHVPERSAGEALRHPGRHGPRVAAGRRGARSTAAAASSALARPWRSSRARRGPARSCGATGCSRACWARSCRSRPRTSRSSPTTRRRPTA